MVKIEIATDNNDQRLVYFILGRITFYCLDFEPIEDAPYFGNDGTYLKINRIILTMQEIMKVHYSLANGEPIDLAYSQTKRSLPSRTNTTLALPRHKMHHPIVMAEEPQNAKEQLDQVSLYFEFVWEFLWAANKASIGQVAGNLTLCTENSTNFYNRTLAIVELYEDILVAEAG